MQERFDFLYPNHKYVSIKHKSDIKLSFRVYEDVFIVPRKGVFDAKYNLINGTGLLDATQSNYSFNRTKAKVYNKPVIYLGQFHHVWGHCLTDNLKRLWFLLKFKNDYLNYDKVFITSGKVLPSNFSTMLSILGIDLDDLTEIKEITKVSKVLIPDESFYATNEGIRYFTKEYQETINAIKEYGQNNFKKLDYDSFFFTYSKYQRKRSIGEEKLDTYFSKLNYQIVSPENCSFDELLNIMLNCKNYASTIASLSHNVVFLNGGSNAYLIPRDFRPNEYQLALNQVQDINVTYIDSTLSLYSNADLWYSDPFYYYLSDNLNNCFGTNEDNLINDYGDYSKLFSIWSNIKKPDYYVKIAKEVLSDHEYNKYIFISKFNYLYIIKRLIFNIKLLLIKLIKAARNIINH